MSSLLLNTLFGALTDVLASRPYYQVQLYSDIPSEYPFYPHINIVGGGLEYDVATIYVDKIDHTVVVRPWASDENWKMVCIPQSHPDLFETILNAIPIMHLSGSNS